MVRRMKDDGGTAVIERTASPEAIAAKVAAADTEARKAQAVADVEAWRQIVADIAAGREPDGKAIAAIGTLAQRLRLPPDAVALSVKAVQEEQRLQLELDATKQRINDVKAREAELAAEMKATEQRLRELNTELGTYHALHRGYPYAAQAVAAVRSENPLLFAQAEHVADRLIKADGGVGTELFKSMVPQRPHLDGLPTRTTWGG